LTANDTAAGDTPARRATSAIVGLEIRDIGYIVAETVT
jgi:hypothetical protein